MHSELDHLNAGSRKPKKLRPLRIVQLVNSLEIGGTERLVVDLAIALQSRGHRTSVVCLRRGGPLQAVLAKSGVEVFMLDKAEGPSFHVLSRLMTYMKQEKIDVMHTHNPLVHHYGVAAGRLSGVPVIVNTIHGPGNLSAKTGLKEVLYGAACRMSDQVIAVCPSAYETFSKNKVIPKRKLTTINNGIPLDQFLAVRPRAADGDFVFGIVGRLAQVKDHRTLLQALSKLVELRPNCRLEILGDGPMRGDLERQSQALGLAAKVVFHGYGADVAGFMGRIDAFVLCSLSEGLPLSVLEAMASGLPVIGTDVGETRGLIEGAGCGWICPPSDSGRLAEVMLRAADASIEERQALGNRGRAFAIEHYSLARMTEEHERLFAALLDNRAAGSVNRS